MGDGATCLGLLGLGWAIAAATGVAQWPLALLACAWLASFGYAHRAWLLEWRAARAARARAEEERIVAEQHARHARIAADKKLRETKEAEERARQENNAHEQSKLQHAAALVLLGTARTAPDMLLHLPGCRADYPIILLATQCTRLEVHSDPGLSTYCTFLKRESDTLIRVYVSSRDRALVADVLNECRAFVAKYKPAS
jgi:hypothetical protein